MGYREYLTTLGLGRLCWWLCVHHPDEVKSKSKKLSYTEDYWQNCFLPSTIAHEIWDRGCLLTEEEMATTVVFGSNDEGDYFVQCPGKGCGLFELPRHGSAMRYLPDGLLKPFECPESARHVFQFPFFEPANDRDGYTGIFLTDIATFPEFWNLVERRWGSTMRVVVRDHPYGPRAFIKSIQGSIAFHESRSLVEMKFDGDFKREVHDELKKLKHLVHSWEGDVPEV